MKHLDILISNTSEEAWPNRAHRSTKMTQRACHHTMPSWTTSFDLSLYSSAFKTQRLETSEQQSIILHQSISRLLHKRLFKMCWQRKEDDQMNECFLRCFKNKHCGEFCMKQLPVRNQINMDILIYLKGHLIMGDFSNTTYGQPSFLNISVFSLGIFGSKSDTLVRSV